MLQAFTEVKIYQTWKVKDLEKDGPISITPWTGTIPVNNDKRHYQVLSFTTVNDLVVDNSWDNMSQFARIVVPRKLKYVVGQEVNINFNDSIDDLATMNAGSQILRTPRKNSLRKAYCSLISPKPGFSKYVGLDGETVDSQDLGFRLNPLIEVGDIVYIKSGYIIRNNKDGGKELRTYETGNWQYYSNKDNVFVNQNSNNTQGDGYRFNVFKGYVTSLDIDNEGNIIISCEDGMYYLNRARIPNKTYHSNDKRGLENTVSNTLSEGAPSTYENFLINQKGYSINSMLLDMLTSLPSIQDQGTSIVGSTMSGILNILALPAPIFSYGADGTTIINDRLAVINNNYIVFNHAFNFDYNVDTIVGDRDCSNMTVGSFLKKVKDEAQIPSFITYDANYNPYLKCTTFRYLDLNAIKGSYDSNNNSLPVECQYNEFMFNDNIIESYLKWIDVQGQPVGAIVKLLNCVKEVKKTKRGKDKLVKAQTNVSVGDAFGTIYTFIYTNTSAVLTQTDVDKLKKEMVKFGQQMLDMNHYTGYKGSFKTYGYPYVRHGDIIKISDPNFTERTGYYYVKRVVTQLTMDEGLIQNITLDYKIPVVNIINQPFEITNNELSTYPFGSREYNLLKAGLDPTDPDL